MDFGEQKGVIEVYAVLKQLESSLELHVDVGIARTEIARAFAFDFRIKGTE